MRFVSRVAGIVGLIAIVATSQASAGVIPVTNSSFEDPKLGPSDLLGGVYNTGPITGWFQGTNPNTVSGVFNPGLYLAAGYVAPDGNQVGWTGNGGGFSFIAQEFGTIVPGAIYTLSALVGQRLDAPLGIYELLIGTLVGGPTGTFTPFAFAFNPVVPTPGTFGLATISGTAPNSATGNLAIALASLQSAGLTQANWDSVTLTSSVPETSTWAMMLIGFAAIGWAAYRRSKPRPSFASKIL